MVSRRRARPSADGQPIVISAPTLKEAYRKVKEELGEEAVILDSRTVTRRQSLGLGSEKMVEVRVQPSGTTPVTAGRIAPGSWSVPAPASMQQPGLAREITREVDRIEELVEAISRQYEERHRQAAVFRDNALARTFLEAGARPGTIEKFLTRFTSETGKEATDRVAALTWLTENLQASNCDWDGFYGCHAFLGRPGCGRTAMVYRIAAKLQELGRKTLVLAIMPEHRGETRRLQTEASARGFDAAVIQQQSQLEKSEAHLARYDVVLVDLPAFGAGAMNTGGPLHRWLAVNPSFHRHLVIPLDSDPEDLQDLALAAKDWHCDWIAASRCDLTGKTGKFLDFSEMVPLPYSLLGRKAGQAMELEIASSGGILDLVLGTSLAPADPPQQEGIA